MIGRSLLLVSRWLLLLILIASVWLWGGTRPWTRELVGQALLTDTLLFGLALLLLGRLPKVPWPAGLAAAVLPFLGALFVWNAHALYFPAGSAFVYLPAPFPSLPGFMDRTLVIPELRLTLGLMGAFCLACDLASNPLWRKRLWWVVAATGVSLVALGLAQRLSGAPAIFWNPVENTGKTFFGTYRYHANAGAYLNLVLPMIGGLAMLSLRQGSPWSKFLWLSSSLVTVAACFVNVSRAAMTISPLLLAAGIPWMLRTTHAHRSHRGQESRRTRGVKTLLITLALILPAITVLAYCMGIDSSWARWASTNYTLDIARYTTYDALVRHVLPVTGWWGGGPGTFEQLFACAISEHGLPITGRWDKAHNDHLQILLEWGSWGYLCWGVLLLGGALRASRLAGQGESSSTRLLGASLCLSLSGVLLHAMVDFPLQIISISLLSLCLAGMAWGTPRNPSP